MPAALDIPAAETAIVEMTNAFRRAHERTAVTPNRQLEAAARAYAKVLSKRQGVLSHSLDGSTPVMRARKAGYAYCQIAENLAALTDSRGFTATGYARRTLVGWEESPGHRMNLLRPGVTETGVAVAPSGPGVQTYVAVQLFGRPRALRYTFKVANAARRAVPYAFGGEEHVVAPYQAITHTACAPGTIRFKIDVGGAAGGRYQARNGQVYTLKPRKGGGVTVELKESGLNP